jgi:7-carboxy-7-deazaguanine synthase
MTVLVNECFGPTIQGEGPGAGRPCVFLRTAICNLHCGWCDTPWSWDWSRFDRALEVHEIEPDDVVAELCKRAGAITSLVISGGEPMLQQRRLVPVLQALDGWWIEVETAGTRPLLADFTKLVDRFNVSPKLANSGNSLGARYRPDVLRELVRTDRAVFKFVARHEGDLPEVERIVEEVGIPTRNVWIMPEGANVADLERHTEVLWRPTIDRGWNLTTRLQVIGWGALRGV